VAVENMTGKSDLCPPPLFIFEYIIYNMIYLNTILHGWKWQGIGEQSNRVSITKNWADNLSEYILLLKLETELDFHRMRDE